MHPLREAMEKGDNRAVTAAHVCNLTEIDAKTLARAYALAEKTCTYWPNAGQIRELAGWSEETSFRQEMGDFAGDAGSRTAERIESQWIRCYRQAVRKARQTHAGGEQWGLLPPRIHQLLRTRGLTSIIPRYGGRSEECNADGERADLLDGDDLSVIKRPCVNTEESAT